MTITRFEAIENFVDPDLRSEYVAGQQYTVRAGNALLADKVEAWVAEGRVKKLPDLMTPARVTGKGEVK